MPLMPLGQHTGNGERFTEQTQRYARKPKRAIPRQPWPISTPRLYPGRQLSAHFAARQGPKSQPKIQYRTAFQKWTCAAFETTPAGQCNPHCVAFEFVGGAWISCEAEYALRGTRGQADQCGDRSARSNIPNHSKPLMRSCAVRRAA